MPNQQQIHNNRVRQGFDRLAPIYDWMVYLSSGCLLFKAKTYYLKNITENKNLLIVGGGTGEFLVAVLKQGFSGSIVFLDISARMIQRARSRVEAFYCTQSDSSPRKRHPTQVQFIQGSIAELPADSQFDAISLNFFLDLLNPTELQQTLGQLAKHSKSGSQLFFCDFDPDKPAALWQKIILRLLYIFFGLSCDLNTRSLPPFHQCLTQAGWKKRAEKSWLAGLIKSRIYQREPMPG